MRVAGLPTTESMLEKSPDDVRRSFRLPVSHSNSSQVHFLLKSNSPGTFLKNMKEAHVHDKVRVAMVTNLFNFNVTCFRDKLDWNVV